MAPAPALLLAAVLALPLPGVPLAPPGGPGPPRLRLRFSPSPPRCCPGGRPRWGGEGRGGDGDNVTVVVLESGRDPPPGSGFRLVLCPLLCRNGGVCAHPQRCLCPPEFTGKFCHLPSANVTSPNPPGNPQNPPGNPQNPPGDPQNPPGDPQNFGEGSPQALTRSVYTLPLSNHREEEDGAQSLVQVLVRHPPLSPVSIHSVERVRGEGRDPSPAPPSPPPGRGRPPSRPPPKFRVLAQRGPPREPPAREDSGFGFCFRQLQEGQCRSPLPGLRTRDICCRGGAGVAWGVRECHPCPGGDQPCPQGFQRQNGTCVDIDECQDGRLCQNGLCTNTRGGFACLCPPGFLLDSSRSSCISQQVLSEARGPCFRLLREGGGCALPTLRNITRQVCCCSRVGKAWGGSCLLCPPFGSEGFREICPAGPGYHYSASDLRINTQFLGQDGTGTPLGPPSRPPSSAPEPPQPGTPRPPPPGPEVIVVPRPSPQFGGALPTLPPPEPVSRCLRDPSVCGPGRCVPRGGGGYTCLCQGGFWLSPQGTHCVDIDECRQVPPPCSPGRCENSPGSFRCLCEPGFTSEPTGSECTDVDECSGVSPCSPHGRCLNTPGSFLCQCQRGYRATPAATAATAATTCQDINECLEGDFCFPHGECLNTAGSFRCLCADGYTATADATACVDVDECERGDVCAGGRCLNTDGSFQCRCPAGFRTEQDKAECRDVDECQEYGAGLCGTQRCQNIPGSYRCLPECQPGFRAEGGECRDVDECSNGTLCGSHASCHNLPGSFQCACDPGYETAPHGHRCVDVDECQTLRGVCGAERCENVEGSFLCLCPDPRQEFDPVSGRCGVPPTPKPPQIPPEIPQNPPEIPQKPPEIPPGFGVASCFSRACGVLAPNVTRSQCCCTLGWAWGVGCPTEPCPTPGTEPHLSLCPLGPGRAPQSPQGPPADVDECSLFAPALCRGGLCVNSAAAFSCFCPSGFYFEPEHLQCVDNDECSAAEAEPCLGGLCVNTVGSFLCSCDPPLILDPSQRRCVANDTGPEGSLGLCWQEVGPDLVCGRPRREAQVSYTECCCLYGQAWGMECALCPAPHSDDFELLCNVLRPPDPSPHLYGPSPHLPLPHFGPLPYGGGGGGAAGPPPPEFWGVHPDPAPFPFFGGGGGYEPLGGGGGAGGFAPPPPPPLPHGPEGFGGVLGRGRGPRFEPPRDPRGGPPWEFQPLGTPEEEEEEEGVLSEECGVLSGCTHGRCVRLGDAFTCACDPGFRLDPARLDCLDIDECSVPPPRCLPGRCLNTPGSFLCLCPPGTPPGLDPPRCPSPT